MLRVRALAADFWCRRRRFLRAKTSTIGTPRMVKISHPRLLGQKGQPVPDPMCLLAEDAGVNRHDPVFHWVMYNIPPATTALHEHLPTDATLDTGAMQGLNVRKTPGFLGPKPPAGQTHPYHFEVFALNTKLDLDPVKADRNAVLAAMKEHVLATGDIVANYTGK
jgi:Raf kinase inhibitor-like YbhB/YbcL family protein